jgi:PAS domain S-box-containing protein
MLFISYPAGDTGHLALQGTQLESFALTAPVNRSDVSDRQWDERTAVTGLPPGDNEPMFRQLFERSADAILLFDPSREVFVDCNQAAVEMMRATSKEQLLLVHPAELSTEFQPDGLSSRQKTREVIDLAFAKGSHRFEWRARRMDGTEFPLEVLLTPIQTGQHPLMATVCRDITERKAREAALRESEARFRSLFERSTDAMSLFDPRLGRFIESNQAFARLAGAPNVESLVGMSPADFAPERQPNGQLSKDIVEPMVQQALKTGSHRFEWMARRYDGVELPIEVVLTAIPFENRTLLFAVSRDISDRKRAEREILELNASLEQRVAQRMAALTTSEARFRALVEHAPEAINVFDGDTGRFLFGNEHACRLYGVTMEKLATLTPTDVSPEFQPGGRRSSELAREKMDEALAGNTSVFEWTHQRPDGSLVPTEVRLLRLPAEGQNLIRASIIDNTERERAQRALRESEEKFRALFEGSSQGVALHDEEQILEVNPAAVRILHCQSSVEILGKHPAGTSPPFQPNGESSDVVARKHIKECMTRGSARFEWVSCTPQGKEIPLEVTLTRIQWSGRQVIQALISDISERKQAEQALHEANKNLLREIEQRSRAEESLNERIRTSMLSTEVALALNAGTEMRAMLQKCAELVVHHLDAAFARIWTLNEGTQTLELRASAGCYTHLDGPHSRVKVGEFKIGLIAQEKKPHLTNNVQTDPRVSDREWAAREGMIAFAGYPLLLEDRVLGVLALFARRPLTDSVLSALGSVADSVALGIERKRAQTALAESEMRFSVAFQASPVFIGILRLSDERIVLVNDAFVNWAGYSREEILGHNTTEITVWERKEDRVTFWEDLRRTGSIRSRECRFRNRSGRSYTMLLSSEVIQISGVPHVLTLGLDITERKQTEAELRASETRLRESEARFSAAFHSSPIITGITRASDGKFVLVNDAAVDWLGYSREEILGRTAVELGLWEDPAARERLRETIRSSRSARELECRLKNRHGKVSTMLASGVNIVIDGVDHLLVMMVDISQRKQAEAELQRTLAREVQLSQLKSNFVSMVSHEFRTPLGIIQSSAELLRDFYEKMQPAERHEQLESITRNTRRMAGMMEEILIFSRLEAGKLDFRPTMLDLNKCCRRLIDEVLSATNRRCQIELAMNSVPPKVKADERLFAHIFTNLLSNAVKYSEPGAVVSFVIERDGPDAVATVRDRGIGIADDDQTHLFKAFHRGGNVGTRPGTGLGLLMVKRCVELHQGNVQLISKLGEGTTVTVRLPVFETDS